MSCVMYCIGCLSLRGYGIVSLQWSPVISFAAPLLALRRLLSSVGVDSASGVALAARGEIVYRMMCSSVNEHVFFSVWWS